MNALSTTIAPSGYDRALVALREHGPAPSWVIAQVAGLTTKRASSYLSRAMERGAAVRRREGGHWVWSVPTDTPVVTTLDDLRARLAVAERVARDASDKAARLRAAVRALEAL